MHKRFCKMRRSDAMRLAVWFRDRVAVFGWKSKIVQARTSVSCYVTSKRGDVVIETRVSNHEQCWTARRIETIFSKRTAKERIRWIRRKFGHNEPRQD